MSTDAMTREGLYRLVEKLPESDVYAVGLFLEFVISRRGQASHDPLTDPVLREFLAAPEDDELWTAEELAAIDEGHTDVVRGELVPWDEAKARLRVR